MKKYLLKVRYALSGLRVYEVETDNIYRIIGKIICTSMEHIVRIDFSKFTPERLQYWIDEGFKISKYKEPVLSEDEKAIEYNERKIKAEAYKEFAQKAAIELTNAYSSEYARWIDDTLNNLLEELVGDNK